MKNRITTLKAWLFGTALVLLAIGFRVAGATPPFHQWQAPTCWYQAGAVVGCVYEDGGTSWTNGTHSGAFDPLVAGKTTVTSSLYVDGGTTLQNLLVTNITATGVINADGGVNAQNGINALSGNVTAVAGAVNASGAGGFDGGVTALGGKTVPVISTPAAAGDNAWNFFVGAVGTAKTLSPAFASGTPHCFCSDLTASQFCAATSTNTTVTITGTGTDSVFVGCLGIK